MSKLFNWQHLDLSVSSDCLTNEITTCLLVRIATFNLMSQLTQIPRRQLWQCCRKFNWRHEKSPRDFYRYFKLQTSKIRMNSGLLQTMQATKPRPTYEFRIAADNIRDKTPTYLWVQDCCRQYQRQNHDLPMSSRLCRQYQRQTPDLPMCSVVLQTM